MFSSNRRQFLRATGTAFAALAASGCVGGSRPYSAGAAGYGSLRSDPAGLVDLPAGFTYRVLSSLGDPMDDGGTVPDHADGMGCFDLGGGKLALVRNHELKTHHAPGVEATAGFARNDAGLYLPGGTTTIVLDAQTLAVERQFRSLAGTYNNCAGGITPWGSWLSCEEAGSIVSELVDGHGWVFEVPAAATGAVEAVPLRAMGRFAHEAACVDPRTGVVYMTEDKLDSLLYRFIPDVPGQLARGGRLQALAVEGIADSRNWDAPLFVPGPWHGVRWVDLDDVEAPADDLRNRGAAQGATLFARGEGIWMGEGELYFTCTNGGTAKVGQVFRLRPQAGGPDRLQLFFESPDKDVFNFGDNLTVAPNGHLIVCEDSYQKPLANYLRGITPGGVAYPIALLRAETEWAGACFSPDGKWLFVNVYDPTTTLAITGPWDSVAG